MPVSTENVLGRWLPFRSFLNSWLPASQYAGGNLTAWRWVMLTGLIIPSYWVGEGVAQLIEVCQHFHPQCKCDRCSFWSFALCLPPACRERLLVAHSSPQWQRPMAVAPAATTTRFHAVLPF